MGDQKPLPAPPGSPLSGDEQEGPRTNRGRPTLPGGMTAVTGNPARSFEPDLSFDDDRAGTPIPDTRPSGALGPPPFAPPPFAPPPFAPPASFGPPVVVMPTISVGDPDLSPLPPPAILDPGEPMPASSKATIAPAMPQIPKPVSYRQAELAPGIVSDAPDIHETQAIPLTVPVRSYRGPILVAAAAAVIGGGIALVAILWLKPASAPADPASTATGTAEAAPAPSAPPSAAPAATAPPAPSAEPSASASAAPSAEPTAVSSAAATASGSATARPTTKPTGAGTRPPRKSDRVED
jgi:hypothetical protein